jgi:DNA repair exonuclease SbcCD ATPase subunit
MIDPVTVLGLVAAIIPIVDKAREIATILVTYKNDSAELEAIISSLTLRLPLLAEILRKIKQATTEEQIRSQRAVLNECSRRMTDLYERLEKLRPKDREGRIAKMRRKSDERERIGEINQRMLDLEVLSINFLLFSVSHAVSKLAALAQALITLGSPEQPEHPEHPEHPEQLT